MEMVRSGSPRLRVEGVDVGALLYFCFLFYRGATRDPKGSIGITRGQMGVPVMVSIETIFRNSHTQRPSLETAGVHHR